MAILKKTDDTKELENVVLTQEATIEGEKGDLKLRVKLSEMNIRKDASLSSDVIGKLVKDDEISVSECKDGFGKLANEEGWILLDFTEKVY